MLSSPPGQKFTVQLDLGQTQVGGEGLCRGVGSTCLFCAKEGSSGEAGFAVLGYVSPSEGDEGELGGKKLTGSRSPSGERGAEKGRETPGARLEERNSATGTAQRMSSKKKGAGCRGAQDGCTKNKRALPPREYL